MERIVYRKTLDVHKNGVQFTLQGFETADKLARRIEISLMSSGDTVDFPLEGVVAMMYVTTPSATEPSINECTIKDNKVIYDVLPITEEGITEMKVKIISTSVDGAKGVLMSPRFAVEVTESDANDEEVTQSTTFTALEEAVAKAQGVYDKRFTHMEIDSDFIFKAYYADGTVYETDRIKECLMHGNALLAKSYAVGDTGVRDGEEIDNSKYYSNVSGSSAEEARIVGDNASLLLEEVRKHGVYTSFGLDFETGELLYSSPQYNFDVDEDTGDLIAEGNTYSFEESIKDMVGEASGADFVIEEGERTTDSTSNKLKTVWRYRIWNSGLAEAWGVNECRYGGDALNTFSNDFSLYDLGDERKYPFYFTKAPCEQATLHTLGGAGDASVFIVGSPYGNSNNKTGKYKAAIINESGTYKDLTLQMHIYVAGKYWKEA
jgi:hypothetical protein